VRIVAALAAVALLLAGCGSSRPAAPSPSLGAVIPVGHPVPAVPLVDQDGRAVTLQSYRGKYVVFAQFLTLCQDECPITTGAFQTMQQSVQRARLADKVVFVEATVDPGRDTPARLRAYQTEFGADWTLLTGTDADIKALWKHFGIFFKPVAEDSPPSIDWWTHQPLTYDVDHTNGFILIDPAGNERFITEDLPDLHGRLPANLESLLDDLGRQHLLNGIAGQSYTIPQALAALSWLVGRHIPLATN
jgi:cytochrome oxidase Cu insertion factor (SCO1/SenC/PrrC family)